MNIKKLIRNICFIVIGAVLITTFIIQIPNPLFNDVGSKDAWIGFFGAITGGALTLYGVWWSIKKQNKDKVESLAIQFRPIIQILRVPPNVATDEVNDICQITIKYKNIGRGEAINIANIGYFPTNKPHRLKTVHLVKLLPSNSHQEIIIDFSIDELQKEMSDNSINNSIHTLKLQYYDLYKCFKGVTMANLYIYYDKNHNLCANVKSNTIEYY